MSSLFFEILVIFSVVVSAISIQFKKCSIKQFTSYFIRNSFKGGLSPIEPLHYG